MRLSKLHTLTNSLINARQKEQNEILEEFLIFLIFFCYGRPGRYLSILFSWAAELF